MLANYSSSEDRPVTDKQTLNLESSFDHSKLNGEDSPPPLLPRSAWNSNLAFLRAILKAKNALDKVEFINIKKH